MSQSTVVINDDLRQQLFNQLIVHIAKWRKERTAITKGVNEVGRGGSHDLIRLDDLLWNGDRFRVLLNMSGCKITLVIDDLVKLYELLDDTHER